MYSIERHGFITVTELSKSLINEMKDHGFVVKYPVDTNGVYIEPTADTYHVILESTTTSNALHATEPWRIMFRVWKGLGVSQTETMSDAQVLEVMVGTSQQLMDNGTIAKTFKGKDQGNITYGTPVGQVGSAWTGNTNIQQQNMGDLRIMPTSREQGFVSRYVLGDAAIEPSYPMSYRMTVTSRGLFIGTWHSMSTDTGLDFCWLCVSRSVDKDTGVIRGVPASQAASKSPVFCVNGISTTYRKFVVREKDVLGPTSSHVTDQDDDDSPAVLNANKQVSFNEDGNYVITFLNNLSTPRFKYADEIDMVGTISADVIGAQQEIEVSVYGEAQPRIYRGLQSNGADSTGMRLLVLVSNPNE